MKKLRTKSTFWQSYLSAIVLGIFIILAAGSEIAGYTKKYIGDGKYQVIDTRIPEFKKITTGRLDKRDRWHGEVTIEYQDTSNSLIKKEIVDMCHGRRHGKSRMYQADGTVLVRSYSMGIQIPGSEKKTTTLTEQSDAFQIMEEYYSWYLFELSAYHYEEDFVETYLDTLELLLNTYAFELDSFDIYYDQVVDSLSDAGYDEFIYLNNLISFGIFIEELKNHELRLSQLDRFRDGTITSYDLFITDYRNYLHSLNQKGISDEDFQIFCVKLDSIMDSFEPVDPDDHFFADSIDSRLYDALGIILQSGETKSALLSSGAATFSTLWNPDIKVMTKQAPSEPVLRKNTSEPAAIADTILTSMLQVFYDLNFLKMAVKKSYLINKGEIAIPTVTTEFVNHNSTTSVNLKANVLDDGGAEVITRGMVWSDAYNPTLNNNEESAGSGVGSFDVTLSGLTEGEIYHVRTYASNNAGTAYGNCISFAAGVGVGIQNDEIPIKELQMYPNPTNGMMHFELMLENASQTRLLIINLQGKVVMQNNLGVLPACMNNIHLDLSALPDGIYQCQVITDHIKYDGNIIILH